MRAKTNFFICVLGMLGVLAVSGGVVSYIDPYMQYHMPLTDKYNYVLNTANERNMNYGIARQFDYNAIVTGTSMTENFKTSEINTIFDVQSIKLPYSGGSYKEINESLAFAFAHQDRIDIVIRALDLGYFLQDKDRMRHDLGEYPTYLYNDNPFDDVKYLLNKNVLFRHCYIMMKNRRHGAEPGITSFDRYAYWQPNYQFGSQTVLKNMEPFVEPSEMLRMTVEEREMVRQNINQNVITLCEAHPDTIFYYFFSPYSAVYWGDLWNKGTLLKQIDAEQYVIELILECDNIRLFSFNAFSDITCDLNNYKDASHYGEWINSLVLQYMHDGVGLLTKDNYLSYIAAERELYTTFDYNSLFDQEDKEDQPPKLK